MDTELFQIEQNQQEYLARLKRLRPIDDDFMRCLFKDDIPLVQFVLRIITQKDDLEIISVETQRDMKRLVGARSICLDAYGEDSTGKKYDIEIQRSVTGAGVHRARYHSSAMDVENLDAGQDFSELPDTYTIFITENDVFGKGKAVYRVERYNIDTEEFFNDGQHILYVNGRYRGDSDIGRLMHDFNCADPEEMFFELFRSKARYLKDTQKGVYSMCREFEEVKNEATANALIGVAKKLIKLGEITFETISQVTGLPIEQIQQLAHASE